jgi:hypothetical protein
MITIEYQEWKIITDSDGDSFPGLKTETGFYDRALAVWEDAMPLILF